MNIKDMVIKRLTQYASAFCIGMVCFLLAMPTNALAATQTWTFTSTTAGDYTYDTSLITVDNSGATIPVANNRITNPSFTTNTSGWNVSTVTPDGWVEVPGNATYGTGNFLVMKYEAKCADDTDLTTGLTSPTTGFNSYNNQTTPCTAANNKEVVSVASGYPISRITQTDAATYCSSISLGGSSAHLLTNDEAMTISRNIEAQAGNWSGGSVGSGYIFAGNNDGSPNMAQPASTTDTGNDRCAYTDTDGTNPAPASCPSFTGSGQSGSVGNQVRTHTLSNGSVIWDYAGNVWEWNNDTIGSNQPHDNGSTGFAWREFSDLSTFGDLTSDEVMPSNGTYDNTNGIGQLYSLFHTNTNTYSFVRGGNWGLQESAGAFALRLSKVAASTDNDLGFRCASGSTSTSQVHGATTGRNNTGGNTIAVGSGSDATLWQQVNVGDTNQYTFSAYVYNNTTGEEGGAIDNTVAELHYDGSSILTNYVSMDNNWWKLTGTITGEASDKIFGLSLKAGKTVIVDNVTLKKSDTYTLYSTTALTDSQVSTWSSFTETATVPGDARITYQLCDDDGSACVSGNKWKYWNGSSWQTAANTTTNVNTAAELTTTAMEAFPTATKKLSFRAIMSIEGEETPDLDSIQIDYATVSPQQIYFTSNNYTVNEADGFATIEVGLYNPAPRATEPPNITVEYFTSDGTALNGTHYTTATGTLDFDDSVDEDIVTFQVPITPDSDYNEDLVVNLTIQNPTGTGITLGAQDTATLTIIDDDGPVVTFDEVAFGSSDYTVAENVGSELITISVLLDEPLLAGESGSVEYVLTNGTALNGTHYDGTNGILYFDDTSDTQTFDVTIIDNGTYDGDVLFNLELINPTGDITLGTPATATTTIEDDETTTVAFTSGSYTVPENVVGGVKTITVELNTAMIGADTGSVNYTITDGTAVNGTNYSATNGTLNFDNTSTTETFDITIIDDTDFDGDKTLTMTLSSPSGDIALGSITSATLTIQEDEPAPPEVSFDNATYTVAEDVAGGIQTITAQLDVSLPTGKTGTVDYEVTDGSGQNGVHYSASNGTLSFDDSTDTATFDITIIDNTDYAGDRTVNLTLTNPTGAIVLGNTTSAVLTITDDDTAPEIGYSLALYEVDEDVAGGTVTIEVVIDSPAPVGGVTVQYATISSGTAEEGRDYIGTTGTLNFAQDEDSKTFDVVILNNTEQQGDVTVDMELFNLTGDVVYGALSTAQIYIIDDEEPAVLPTETPTPTPAGTISNVNATLSSNYYLVQENIQTQVASIPVVLSGPAPIQGGTVTYTTRAITAQNGTHFSQSSGTVTFNLSQTTKNISIPIVNNSIYETANRTFTVSITAAANGINLGETRLATVEIIDDDQGLRVPVYRFWSDQKQGHFYTASEAEREFVIQNYPQNVWRYEGIGYHAFSNQQPGTVPIHRFWSDKMQGHFYTASEEEKNYVINAYDDFVWRYEGIGFYSYPLASTRSTSIIYRFWSETKQKHFYTASAEERDYIINTFDDRVWRYEGDAWKTP